MTDRDFEEVCRLTRREQQALFERGEPPPIESLAGWDFRGWNSSLLPKLGGFQKFVKGFYRKLDARPGEGEGFNCPVLQNGLDGEWLALPADDEPKRFGFYTAAPLREPSARAPAESLLLDYGAHPANPLLDPSRRLRDLLVEIDGDPDLLLGKAHVSLGRWFFAGYFVLARRREHAYRP